MRSNLLLRNRQVGEKRGWLKLTVGLTDTAMSKLVQGEGICISVHMNRVLDAGGRKENPGDCL